MKSHNTIPLHNHLIIIVSDLQISSVSADSSDYTISTTSITIGSDESILVTIDALDDHIIEEPELFEITVTNLQIATAVTVNVDPKTLAVYITDPMGAGKHTKGTAV